MIWWCIGNSDDLEDDHVILVILAIYNDLVNQVMCVFFNDFDGDFNDSKDFGNPGDCEGSDIEFQWDSDNLGILVIF